MVGESSCHLQLSQLPTLSGPRFSLRFSESKSKLPTALELLPQETLRETVLGAIKQPGQFVVLAGKPRSGRSTTAYGLIQALRDDHGLSNILTLEREPWANLRDVPQVKVDGHWEQALEASVFQAPELLVVDPLELSDLGDLVGAADAGHTTLVCVTSSQPLKDLSQLSREEEFGEMMLERLDLLLHQVLLPRLCPACREDYEPSAAVKGQLVREHLADSDQTFFRSAGCKSCRGSGMLGKTPVLEALTLNPMIRELLQAGRAEDAIRKTALGSGLLIPFRASAKVLLRQGDIATTTALRYFGRS
jgi:type II secretory ATPase GspE/PulE/Tfp pilus assembly ATPase PilB-like protein